jgi:hypothetical protein
MGFALPDDRMHAPNEKFHLPNLHKGIATSISFLGLVGSLGDPPVQRHWRWPRTSAIREEA